MLELLNRAIFSKALLFIKNNNISPAVKALMGIAPGHMENDLKQLCALCLYRLGEFNTALSFVPGSDRLYPEYRDEAESFAQYSKELEKQLSSRNYKAALALAEKRGFGSVRDKNILACLFMLCGKKGKALIYFNEALEMDISNETTVRLLSAASIAENENLFSRFFKSLKTNTQDTH